MNMDSPNTCNNTNNNSEPDRNELDQMLLSFGLSPKNLWAPSDCRVTKLDNGKLDKMIRDYFNFSKEDKNIFAVNIWQVSDTNRFVRFMRKGFYEVDNYMLWHGTMRVNLVSILDSGLRLPAPASNHCSLGPGIYLADRVALSSSYTDGNGPEVMLLCQVAIGKIFDEPPSDHGCVIMTGIFVPEDCGQQRYGNWIFPSGQSICDTTEGLTIGHNQYVVYDPDRVLVKFVVQCSRRIKYIKPTFATPISKDLTVISDNYSSMSSPPLTPTTPITPIGTISPFRPDYY